MYDIISRSYDMCSFPNEMQGVRSGTCINCSFMTCDDVPCKIFVETGGFSSPGKNRCSRGVHTTHVCRANTAIISCGHWKGIHGERDAIKTVK